MSNRLRQSATHSSIGGGSNHIGSRAAIRGRSGNNLSSNPLSGSNGGSNNGGGSGSGAQLETPDMINCKKRIQEAHMRNLKEFLDDYAQQEAEKATRREERYARLEAEAREKFRQDSTS